MKSGTLRYKCRMCGEEYDGNHVGELIRALSVIVNGEPCPWPEMRGMWSGLVSIHFHHDGTMGASDLIGGIEDD